MTKPPKDQRFQSVLIFGPPGSGKGTVGKVLAGAGEHFHLSSGDIFRGLSKDSPSGKIFHEYASKGNLVPDDVTIEIWHNYVSGLIATNRYFPSKQLLMLDGIPRTVKQAQIFDDYIDLKKIILIDVPEEILIERLSRRAKVEGRFDDTKEDVLKQRMEVYKNQTFEVLSHYSETQIEHFNGNQSRLEVLRDILQKLATSLTIR